jgi:hypothetical protein
MWETTEPNGFPFAVPHPAAGSSHGLPGPPMIPPPQTPPTLQRENPFSFLNGTSALPLHGLTPAPRRSALEEFMEQLQLSAKGEHSTLHAVMPQSPGIAAKESTSRAAAVAPLVCAFYIALPSAENVFLHISSNSSMHKKDWRS